LAIEAPGDDWDYLGGDGSMLFSGNHCLVTPSGLTKGTMERYVKLLLQHSRHLGADLPEWIETFRLVPIGDNRMIQQLLDQGVKSISLHVGQYLETLRDSNDDRINIAQDIGRFLLSTLVTRDEDRRLIEEAENVNARLIISLDGRRKGVTHEVLSNVASNVVDESPNDVEFVTPTGQIFKRGDFIIRKTIDLDSNGQTVDYRQCWSEMLGYFDELHSAGILEL
jgi:nucleotide-binding universal stress UspA family protein